jgi:hypothetical protein
MFLQINIFGANAGHYNSSYNPSFSGGRDQEDGDLKATQASSLQDPISKKKKSQ